MVLRYLLEYAGDVAEACELMQRVPVNGAYNVMLLDRENHFENLAVVPGQEMLKMGTRVSTNHQPGSSWPIYEEKVSTHLRYRHRCTTPSLGAVSARYTAPPSTRRAGLANISGPSTAGLSTAASSTIASTSSISSTPRAIRTTVRPTVKSTPPNRCRC